jgi:50S ribosomal protein L16 3-hydroxylase
MKTGLAALLHPHEVSEFMEAFKENVPFVVHGTNPHLNSIYELPFLKSLNTLLNSWPLPVQGHLPDVRDEASSIDVSSIDAAKLYANGMGLLFNEVQSIAPMLSEWLQDIRKALGISAVTIGRCLIYATPDGKGTAPHFDQNMNFVLQIHGTKKWKLANNQHIKNPLTRHTIGLEPDPELSSYMTRSMPLSMPDEVHTYDLSPGSVLFVPRGWWHSTEADGDALALNFTFSAPTWIDLFTAALRGRLAQSPDWRETAIASNENKFEYLLKDLVKDLPNWSSSDILDVTEYQDREI